MATRRAPLVAALVIGGIVVSLAVLVHVMVTEEQTSAPPDAFGDAFAFEDEEDAAPPPPLDVTPVEPRLIAPSEARSLELVDALVTVDDEVVGIATVEDRVERLTLDREGARWTERRVLATSRPAGGELVRAAQPLHDGHFALLLEGRDDGVLRVLDTSTGADRTLPEDAGRVDHAEPTGDGFRFLTFRDEAWRVFLDPRAEDEVMELPARALGGSSHQQDLREGMLLRVETDCANERCDAVLTRVNLVGGVHDEIARHWYQENDEHGLRDVAANSEIARRPWGALAVFRTWRDEEYPNERGFALVAIDALDESLATTRLPFPDPGGPGTWMRFTSCGDALWIVAIAHGGPDHATDPRLQALRVLPAMDPRPRDLGAHQNLEWRHVHFTCDGEDLLVVRWTELYELR